MQAELYQAIEEAVRKLAKYVVLSEFDQDLVRIRMYIKNGLFTFKGYAKITKDRFDLVVNDVPVSIPLPPNIEPLETLISVPTAKILANGDTTVELCCAENVDVVFVLKPERTTIAIVTT